MSASGSRSPFAAIGDARQRLEGDKRMQLALGLAVLLALFLLPFGFQAGGGFIDDATTALAYVVMALGLNIVVGFAGLLDLGYVAFFAIGAYAAGWFGSGFFASINDEKGLHILALDASSLPGIHLNWVLIALAAVTLTAVAGILIGLPTLRLRGDYIAIVTLAFGEIVRVVAVNGNEIKLGKDSTLTAGRQGITPVDPIQFPGGNPFDPLNLRPWYWTALVLVLIVL